MTFTATIVAIKYSIVSGEVVRNRSKRTGMWLVRLQTEMNLTHSGSAGMLITMSTT